MRTIDEIRRAWNAGFWIPREEEAVLLAANSSKKTAGLRSRRPKAVAKKSRHSVGKHVGTSKKG